jgi:hypothetical protein
VVLVLAACSSRSASNGHGEAQAQLPTPTIDGGKPMSTPKSTIDLVRQSVSPDVNVQGPAMQVAGLDVFELVPEHGNSTGAVVAGGKVLQGLDGLRAVMSATQDTEQIASVALLFAGWGQGSDILDTPTRSGDTLTFKVHGGPGKALDYDATVDLTTGNVNATPSQQAMSAGDVVTRAIQLLPSKNKTDWSMAIAGLAEQCTASKPARDALLGAIKSHVSAEARVEAAKAAAACGPAAVDTLVAALDDPDTNLQAWAASSLGKIGDARARPGLEKAAKSSDAGVQYAAQSALKKLP